MKIFKLDLMTVLAIIVFIGVVVTMSTQASDYAPTKDGAIKVSAPMVGKA